MTAGFSSWLVWPLLFAVLSCAQCDEDDDFESYVASLSLNATAINVLTPDAYILRMYRIFSSQPSGGPAVLLHHGFLSSCWCWMAQGNDSVAVRLVRQGFDVFLANSRGNVFSMNLTDLKDDSSVYWNFTFADMANNDVAVLIGFIIENTKSSRVAYVGWSQGATQLLLASSGVDYNMLRSRVSIFVALSPLLNLHQTTSPFFRALAQHNLAAPLLSLFPHGMLLSPADTSIVETTLCGLMKGDLCNVSLASVYGHAPSDADDANSLARFAANFPAGTSARNIVAFLQSVTSNRFAEYDYGPAENRIVYGQSMPPVFDLSARVRVALFAGSADALLPESELERLIAAVTHKLVFNRTYADFSHITWFVGKSSTWIDDLISVLSKYTTRQPADDPPSHSWGWRLGLLGVVLVLLFLFGWFFYYVNPERRRQSRKTILASLLSKLEAENSESPCGTAIPLMPRRSSSVV